MKIEVSPFRVSTKALGRKYRHVILGVICLVAFWTPHSFAAARFADGAETDSILRTKSANPELRVRYYAEVARLQFQRGQLAAARMANEGLRYAASKLCENEMRDDLDKFIQDTKTKVAELSADLQRNQVLQNSVAQHLETAGRNSKSNPALAAMENALAKMELTRWIHRSDKSAKVVGQIGQQLIKSEVIYQRVLAECLLKDFKSIFGGQRPIPEPDRESDLIPDESSSELWEFDESDSPEFFQFEDDG